VDFCDDIDAFKRTLRERWPGVERVAVADFEPGDEPAPRTLQ
jgi:hypothetical protein